MLAADTKAIVTLRPRGALGAWWKRIGEKGWQNATNDEAKLGSDKGKAGNDSRSIKEGGVGQK